MASSTVEMSGSLDKMGKSIADMIKDAESTPKTYSNHANHPGHTTSAFNKSKVPHQLEVRSNTVVGTKGPVVTTEPGTQDVMPQVQTDTTDTMPKTRLADQSPLDRGDKVVSTSQHFSWKAFKP